MSSACYYCGAESQVEYYRQRGLNMLGLLIQAGYDASLPHPECFKNFSYLKLAELLDIAAAGHSPLSEVLQPDAGAK